MKFGLENISRLCAALGHPERSFQSVIVAGTNGKGSVTAMVHRALLAAGHLAARYTSPHLERLEERFVIGADEVEPEELEAAAAIVRDTIADLQRNGALDTPPTFFECATAIAFVLFRRAQVSLAVLEVGLGGRLDATNVVTPLAAAITSIDFDHQAQLGDTLEAIAFEKAGVIKPNIPVVCGDIPRAAEEVIRRVCDERASAFVRASTCEVVDELVRGSRLSLAGRHQEQNARVAACLLRQLALRGVGMDDSAIRAALADVEWPGRLEQFQHRGADVLLDAAHNPAGARALAAYLRDSGWTDVALIISVMQDKDVSSILSVLMPVCRHVICTTAPTPRAMSADALAAIARTIPRSIDAQNGTVVAVPAPADALAAALRVSSRIVVAGSIFLIGPVRGILRPR
jgi:dihydrofolate synthase / folylpolyglutamate synthase